MTTATTTTTRYRPTVARASRRCHDAQDREQGGGLRSRVALRGMARRNVADLVADHARHLRLGVRECEQSARDVDIPAREREGVRLLHLDHVEAVLDVLPGRVLGELAAELLDVVVQRLVVDDAQLRLDLLRGFVAELLLGLLRHEDELFAAGDRVGPAAAAPRHGKHQQGSQQQGAAIPDHRAQDRDSNRPNNGSDPESRGRRGPRRPNRGGGGAPGALSGRVVSSGGAARAIRGPFGEARSRFRRPGGSHRCVRDAVQDPATPARHPVRLASFSVAGRGSSRLREASPTLGSGRRGLPARPPRALRSWSHEEMAARQRRASCDPPAPTDANAVRRRVQPPVGSVETRPRSPTAAHRRTRSGYASPPGCQSRARPFC